MKGIKNYHNEKKRRLNTLRNFLQLNECKKHASRKRARAIEHKPKRTNSLKTDHSWAPLLTNWFLSLNDIDSCNFMIFSNNNFQLI